MALDENGKILAVRAQALHAVGAYVTNAGVVPVLCALRNIPNVYVVPAMLVASKATFTHTTPLGPYRGAGRPEASYVIERLMDEAARKLGDGSGGAAPAQLHPAERHAVQHHRELDRRRGGRLDLRLRRLRQAHRSRARAFRLARVSPRERRRAKDRKRLRGRSLIYYLEDSGVFNERMELRFDPSGMVTIVAGTHSHGQGHATTYAQLVSDWLGVPFENIRLVQGDTDAVAFGRGTYASRSAMLGGSALKGAADAIVEKAKPMAAHLMEASPRTSSSVDGKFTRRRHRPVDPADRCGQGASIARSARPRSSAPASTRAARRPCRRPSRTAAMSASSRSIRRPAR